jgi:hypothetical protein
MLVGILRFTDMLSVVLDRFLLLFLNATVIAIEKIIGHNPTISSAKRSAWKKAEACKKRTIIKAKRKSWLSFINNLNPHDGHKTS